MIWAVHVACMRLVGKPEDLRIGWRIVLKWMLKEIRWDGMKWIDLAHERNQWRAVVNTVMNI
jgi:hypothetical protein